MYFPGSLKCTGTIQLYQLMLVKFRSIRSLAISYLYVVHGFVLLMQSDIIFTDIDRMVSSLIQV